MARIKQYITDNPRTARPKRGCKVGTHQFIASERELFRRYQTCFMEGWVQYLSIPRRTQQMQNAQRLPKKRLPKLRGYNPAYMNAADLEAMNVKPGDKVKIASKHGEIVGFVDIDNNLRQGVLSMCHGYGVAAGEEGDPAEIGSNVNHLNSWEDDFDPYLGMPRMGALPVSVTAMASRWPNRERPKSRYA